MKLKGYIVVDKKDLKDIKKGKCLIYICDEKEARKNIKFWKGYDVKKKMLKVELNINLKGVD